MKKLMYLKGYPEQIRPTLEAFKKYQDEPDNRRLINAELYPKLLSLRKARKGIRKKDASKTSLIHNQAIPACYALGLLTREGRPKQTRLTQTGEVLLNTLKVEGNEGYLRKLGKVLLDFDRRNNKVIETIEALRKTPGGFVSIVSLIIGLHKKSIDASEKMVNLTEEEEKRLKESGIAHSEGSRLSDLLKYYQFFDIIITRGSDVYLNTPRLKEIDDELLLRSLDSISDGEFFGALVTAYEMVKGNERTGAYVPIWPHVRDRVCNELNISHGDFARKLASLPMVMGTKQIHLAHPGRGRPKYQLTELGKEYYYYIAVFEGKENDI
jgi:hypothetical protein